MTDLPSQEPDEKRMSLGEHLDELRRRLIYMMCAVAAAMLACLLFASRIIGFLEGPYKRAMESLGLEGQLIVLEVASGLTTLLRVSFYAGLLVSSPFVIYQAWAFIAAGLYERERRYVRMAVPFSAALFIAGAAFFLLVVSERILYYLLKLSTWLGMAPRITFDSFISFMMRTMVVFGVGFQTPLAIVILTAAGLVGPAALRRYRKHVIVGILALAALLTPPDPFSQIALAVPMWLLYELGVLLSWLYVRKRRGRQSLS